MIISQDKSADKIARAAWAPVGPIACDFDFPGWKTAKPIHITRYWSGEAAPVARQADARVLWSEDALHVLYACHQHEPLIVSSNPQTAEKTPGLWERDVCEIFIAPDPATPNNYFEFEAAPTGEWLDVAIQFTEEGKQSDWEFKSRMSVAAKVVGPRLLISMRIPWSQQITKPTSGSLWRANFFRCIGDGPGRGYLAWQPTLTEEPNFHVPAVFGSLMFD
jgi:alpha-galactosidase